MSSFAATGIYSINPNVYSYEDFYAANIFTQNEVSQNYTNDLITMCTHKFHSIYRIFHINYHKIHH